MRTVRVELGSHSYDIRIGAGLLNEVGSLLKQSGFSGKLVVITDPTVHRQHGSALEHALARENFNVITLEIPEGEAQKSLDNAIKLYRDLTEAYADRSTPLLAFGGGVIGDLAGFVAATYLRGLPFIQIPTTLLAQVDSSIGGKTGVDHGKLKNRIGAFYQPKMVISDLSLVKTLPAAEVANGLAEIIKSAAIKSQDFFAYLETNIEKLKALDPVALEEAVYRTARIKAEIVAQDEEDRGLRNILNFGHTVGHALESLSDFNLRHGQAVAIGMYAAARISSYMELLPDDEVRRLKNLIERAGLPTKMPQLTLSDLARIMQRDKKVHREKFRFVVLESIGSAIVVDSVTPDIVEQVATT